MYPQTHFLAGLLACAFLYFGFPDIATFSLFIFLLSTILIDIDHYFYHVYKSGDINLIKIIRRTVESRKKLLGINNLERKKYYNGFWFLHGFEILILALILGYFFETIFYFVFLGLLFHLVLDYVDIALKKSRLDKVSSIYDFFKYKKLVHI